MLFHSPEFIILMLITLVLYYLAPKVRIYILAIANILFYGVTGLGYLALFVGICIATYLISLHLQEHRYKKAFLWAGILLNVFNLVFFKYSLFLLTNIERYLPIDLVVEDTIFTKLVLPIGISFYTFQIIAYLVDVYKKEIKPNATFMEFWVFISFFGQLIAGPIMRGKEFIPQVEALEKIRYSHANIKLGVAYFAMGLFKKVVLADNISPIVDQFFVKGTAMSGGEAWMAMYLFAFQIYLDFSAYSEMALGVGHLFGLKLALNFRTPYMSGSVTEFWRRWNITLSHWIRDYIYIPLGGSRRGKVRQQFNQLAAMGVSGLWHGAAWTFIAWGLFHGVMLIIHKHYNSLKARLGIQSIEKNLLYHGVAVFLFFQLNTISWVFFRTPGIENALILVKKMIFFNPLALEPIYYGLLAKIILLYMLHIVEYFARKNAGTLSSYWHKWFPAPVRALAYTAFLAMILLFLQGKQTAFIYFQF